MWLKSVVNKVEFKSIVYYYSIYIWTCIYVLCFVILDMYTCLNHYGVNFTPSRVVSHQSDHYQKLFKSNSTDPDEKRETSSHHKWDLSPFIVRLFIVEYRRRIKSYENETTNLIMQ